MDANITYLNVSLARNAAALSTVSKLIYLACQFRVGCHLAGKKHGQKKSASACKYCKQIQEMDRRCGMELPFLDSGVEWDLIGTRSFISSVVS